MGCGTLDGIRGVSPKRGSFCDTIRGRGLSADSKTDSYELDTDNRTQRLDQSLAGGRIGVNYRIYTRAALDRRFKGQIEVHT